MVKLRLWTGEELEGPNKGTMTLFVESEHFDYGVREQVQAILHDPTFKCKAVYLGAGRQDLRNIDIAQFKLFLSQCRYTGVTITIETTTQLSKYALLPIDWRGINIVYTIDLPDTPVLLNNLFFKVEMPRYVEMTKVRNSYATMTNELEDGLYKGTDVLVYDSKEDCNE